MNIDITSILLGLLGGLALFLYGMQMMSSGLEAAAGNRMKHILEKLTANRVLGVLVGAGITAVIQSSSATTVMVVGFVNSGMMTLRQAVWIIMGANIGTTITGQLIALDVGALAPLFAFVGVAMVVFLKKPQIHHYGSILAGLGVLFIGMEMMGSAMEPLREWPAFVNVVSTFSNPLIGILVGAGFTAIIQSSSASVGILQALAISGVIGLDSAVYVLFGQNIGTCITAVLASIGTSRNAKRTTIIHLMFNVFGTILFTFICMFTPLTTFMQSLTPTNPAAQIANMHTLFNVVTTLILLPLGGYLVKIAMRILPDQKEEQAEGMHLAYLVPNPTHTKQEHPIGFSAMYITQLRQELNRMLEMAKSNIATSFQAVLERDTRRLEEAEATEEYIDFLNKEISQYISKVIVHETNEQDSTAVSAYFKITGNIERIGRPCHEHLRVHPDDEGKTHPFLRGSTGGAALHGVSLSGNHGPAGAGGHPSNRMAHQGLRAGAAHRRYDGGIPPPPVGAYEAGLLLRRGLHHLLRAAHGLRAHRRPRAEYRPGTGGNRYQRHRRVNQKRANIG